MATQPTYNEYSWIGEELPDGRLKAIAPELGLVVEADKGPDGKVGVPLHEAMAYAFSECSTHESQ